MRYPFIQEHQEQFRLSALCRAMQVSRSGFYAWRQRPQSARQQENEALTEQIRAAHEQSQETYGSPRAFAELQEQGVACSQKRVARLMRAANLSAVLPKRFVVTTDSDHEMLVAENLLARTFEVETPETKWTADITYIWTSQGWLYLAIILDLFSRRIVGSSRRSAAPGRFVWAMAATIERSLVMSALEMATVGRKPDLDLICHSDRGSQYASLDYQKQLKEAGIVCSMSRRGNCWDG